MTSAECYTLREDLKRHLYDNFPCTTIETKVIVNCRKLLVLVWSSICFFQDYGASADQLVELDSFQLVIDNLELTNTL
jgi:hypothetical protein